MENKPFDDCVYRFRSIELVNRGHADKHKRQVVYSYMIVAAVAGEARIGIDNGYCALRPGKVCWAKPEQTLAYEELSEDAVLFAVRFDAYSPIDDSPGSRGSMLQKVTNVDLLNEYAEATISPSDKLAEICEEMNRAEDGGGALARLKCQTELHRLLSCVLENRRTGREGTDSTLEMVKKYVEEHYSEALTISRLARMADLSPNYFVDLFGKRYGRSVMDYVAELRLQEAKRLLSRGEWRLKDLAQRVGYRDEFYFSRKFKKHIGVSPKAYRQSRPRKLVAYGPAMLGSLVPLGVLPYAAPLHPKWTEYYYRNFRQDIPIHLHASSLRQVWQDNIELLKPLSADVILAADDIGEEEKQGLADLAQEIRYVPLDLDWRERLRYVAKLLGETWQAEQWLEQYEASIASAKERIGHATFGKRCAVLRVVQDRLYLYCNPGMKHILHDVLGMRSAYSAEDDVHNAAVTLEELAGLPIDRLFLLVRQDSETLEAWNRLQVDPVWGKIDAVNRNRLYAITSDPWREYSAHALARMLEQATKLLSENRS